MPSPLCVFFISALVAASFGQGSTMKIDIHVNKYDGIFPTSYTVSCLPEVKIDCTKDVITLQVSKQGSKPLASIRRNSEVFYNPLLAGNIKAEGSLDKDFKESHLTVTYTNAVQEDSGVYSCIMYYLDEWGNLQQDVASQNFTIEAQETQDIVRYLMNKLTAMEDQLIEQKETQKNYSVEQEAVSQAQQSQLAEQKVVLQVQEHTLMAQAAVLQAQEKQLLEQKGVLQAQGNKLIEQEGVLQAQGKQLVVQEKDIERLDIRRQNYTTREGYFPTGFSVGYHDNAIESGKTLVFSHIILNIQERFDPHTGIYTAPTKGLYVFHLFLTTDSSKGAIDVDLKANGKVVASLKIADKDYKHQSSISTLVSLEAGHEVKPELRFVDASYSDNNILSTDHFSMFSGYLLKAL